MIQKFQWLLALLVMAAVQCKAVSVPKYDTVADMILSVPTTTASALVLGRASSGDGGGGDFYFSPGSSAATNLGTVFASGTGRWIRLAAASEPLNVKWFGAKGDDTTDDTTAIQDCLNVACNDQSEGFVNYANYHSVYFPRGLYVVSQTLYMRGTGSTVMPTIRGESRMFTCLVWNGDLASDSILHTGAKTYKVASGTRTSNVCTVTIGTHDIEVGDTIGVLYGPDSTFISASLTASAVTGTTVSYTLAGADGAMAAPGVGSYFNAVRGVISTNEVRSYALLWKGTQTESPISVENMAFRSKNQTTHLARAGIFCWGSLGLGHITDCSFGDGGIGLRDGIVVFATFMGDITRNEFRSCLRDGIATVESNAIWINKNEFSGTGRFSTYVFYGDTHDISLNDFEGTTGPQQKTVASITLTNNIATVTTTGGHTDQSGGFEFYSTANAIITGCSNSIFNGTWEILTVPDTNHFTFDIRYPAGEAIDTPGGSQSNTAVGASGVVDQRTVSAIYAEHHQDGTFRCNRFESSLGSAGAGYRSITLAYGGQFTISDSLLDAGGNTPNYLIALQGVGEGCLISGVKSSVGYQTALVYVEWSSASTFAFGLQNINPSLVFGGLNGFRGTVIAGSDTPWVGRNFKFMGAASDSNPTGYPVLEFGSQLQPFFSESSFPSDGVFTAGSIIWDSTFDGSTKRALGWRTTATGTNPAKVQFGGLLDGLVNANLNADLLDGFDGDDFVPKLSNAELSSLVLNTSKSPSDIASLVAWYRADDIAAATNNAPVLSWSDASGNTHTLSDTHTTAAATYVTNVANGHSVVRFAGSAASARLASGAFTTAQPLTVIAVLKKTIGTTGEAISGKGGTTTHPLFFDTATHVRAYFGAYGQITTITDDGAFHVATSVANGTLSKIYWDGVYSAADGTVGTDSMGGITIGAHQSGSDWITGDVAEVILFNEELSAGDRTGIETYLQSKYGLSTVPPLSVLDANGDAAFSVNASGNITKLNGVTTSFPSSQGAASTFLKNNGSGTLTWDTPSGDNWTASGTTNSTLAGKASANLGAFTNGITAGASTFTGDMIFSADNTYNIGASGATRPKHLYLAGQIVMNSLANVGSVVLNGGSGSVIRDISDGRIEFLTDSTAANAAIAISGLFTKYTASAVDISVSAVHSTVALTATGKTATLPTAVGISGRQYTIVLNAVGTGTIATTSSQTIGEVGSTATTYTLTSTVGVAAYNIATVQSDGSNWIVIGH